MPLPSRRCWRACRRPRRLVQKGTPRRAQRLDRSIATRADVDVSDGVSVELRLAALEAQIVALVQERDEYRKLVLHLREENERLWRRLLGQNAERLPKNDAPLSLLMLGLA